MNPSENYVEYKEVVTKRVPLKRELTEEELQQFYENEMFDISDDAIDWEREVEWDCGDVHDQQIVVNGYVKHQTD